MKNLYQLPALILLILINSLDSTLRANPGDTTWVSVWSKKKLLLAGTYDTNVVFPTGKQYRKIRLHYIIGGSLCPPNSSFCWYGNQRGQLYAMAPGKDTVEIMRSMSPWGSQWYWLNKRHEHIIDVSDYSGHFDGNTGIRFVAGGNFTGFNLTVKLELIEGVPPSNVVSVHNIYRGNFPYGRANNSIENYLGPMIVSYPATTSRAIIKTTATGHEFDSLLCPELCDKYYEVKLNNLAIAQKQLWRNDCGLNQVSDQIGPWIYNRANWCAGSVVKPYYHDISALTMPNTNFIIDVDMESYTSSDTLGYYSWSSQFIQYSAPNHSLDVSIEAVVSPTYNDDYYRENPACMNPRIIIKNTGSIPVTSVGFKYTLNGGAPLTHVWSGGLHFMEETEVPLPPSASMLGMAGKGTFQVNVVSVNGFTSDQNPFNNVYSSSVKDFPLFPSSFIVKFVTDNNADAITGKSQTTWKLTDQNGNVVAKREQVNTSTVYVDTLRNLSPGCYKLSVDDSGCDGMSGYHHQSTLNGNMRIDYLGANNTILHVSPDFGCNHTRHFMIPANLTGLNKEERQTAGWKVFPNPTEGELFAALDLPGSQNVKIIVMDLSGRVVKQQEFKQVSTSLVKLDTASLETGIYIFQLQTQEHQIFNAKVVVSK